MDKSGTQNPDSSNFAKVNGWTARANSSVVNNSLVIIGGGAATVAFQVQFTENTSHQARLNLNGSPVAVGNSFSGTGTSSGSVSLTLAAGDVLELYGTSGLSSRSTFGTATFVTITPVT